MADEKVEQLKFHERKVRELTAEINGTRPYYRAKGADGVTLRVAVLSVLSVLAATPQSVTDVVAAVTGRYGGRWKNLRGAVCVCLRSLERRGQIQKKARGWYYLVPEEEMTAYQKMVRVRKEEMVKRAESRRRRAKKDYLSIQKQPPPNPLRPLPSEFTSGK